VAEIGTHSELMAKEGIYQQLVTLQMFGDKVKEESGKLRHSTKAKRYQVILVVGGEKQSRVSGSWTETGLCLAQGHVKCRRAS
jgi:predicted SpoU family rRNA methylase